MIFLDHNATTPLWPEVSLALCHAVQAQVQTPANPSSVHQAGRAARARLTSARERMAQLVGSEPKEICFVASGSEADALAIKGVFEAGGAAGRDKLVLSSIEHPALLGAAKQLEQKGVRVVRIPPEPSGRVSAERVIAELDERTLLCSLMWANNETGVLQPVQEVARAAKERGVLFHTDAVQAAGKVPVSLREVSAELLSLSAHKVGGPAGVGVLVLRRGLELGPLVPGHQEWGRRGGTPNVALIEAAVLAFELSARRLDEEAQRLGALRAFLEEAARARVGGVTINGGDAPRVPNTTNLRFDGVDGEALLIALDLLGFCVSSGAACASGAMTPSHVLTAMGLSAKLAQESVRVSLGRTTTAAEVEGFVAALEQAVPRARAAAAQVA